MKPLEQRVELRIANAYGGAQPIELICCNDRQGPHSRRIVSHFPPDPPDPDLKPIRQHSNDRSAAKDRVLNDENREHIRCLLAVGHGVGRCPRVPNLRDRSHKLVDTTVLAASKFLREAAHEGYRPP